MIFSSGKTIRGWLQLVRPPNLLTVPGDPAAGYVLALSTGAGNNYINFIPALLVSLLFYMAGLISNDCFDWRENSRSRPDRPIPSGAVSIKQAASAAAGLFTLGLIIAGAMGMKVFICALILVALILIYNSIAKRIPLVGGLFMGACRGCSLLLGAVAAGYSFPFDLEIFLPALGLMFYIMIVTLLAARETERTAMPIKRWLPGIIAAITMVGVSIALQCIHPVFIALAVTAVIWPFFIALKLGVCPEPEILGAGIGSLIRGLILIQAAYLAAAGSVGMIGAGILLLTWPISVYLSRRFYAS